VTDISAESRWHAAGPDCSICPHLQPGVDVAQAPAANPLAPGPPRRMFVQARPPPSGPRQPPHGSRTCIAPVATAPYGTSATTPIPFVHLATCAPPSYTWSSTSVSRCAPPLPSPRAAPGLVRWLGPPPAGAHRSLPRQLATHLARRRRLASCRRSHRLPRGSCAAPSHPGNAVARASELPQ